MSTSKKSWLVVFFGTENFSAKILENLLKHPELEVVATITKPDRQKGRGRKISYPPVKELLIQNNLGATCHQPKNTAELIEALRQITPKPAAGVLASFGQILPAEMLALFPLGIINLHPSLLPKYRGSSPIEQAILNGDRQTGVSLIRLVEAMDAGPIFATKTLTLSGKETSSQLYDNLATLGNSLINQKMVSILDESIKAKPQDENQATYCQFLTKEMARLEPSTKTAAELEREIRAFVDFPKSRLKICQQDCLILSATVVDQPELDQLTVPCAQQTYLQVDQLRAANGKQMSGKDFIRGYVKDGQLLFE